MRRNGAWALATLAVAALCWACEQGPEPPAGLLDSAAARERGRALFDESCALCHGARGDGQGERATALSGPPANFANPYWRRHADPREVFQVIRQGLWGTSMPAWPALDDQATWDLVAYLFSVAETPTPKITLPRAEGAPR